jgi:hypothetical protein
VEEVKIADSPALDYLIEELDIGQAATEPGANWFSLTLELELGPEM